MGPKLYVGIIAWERIRWATTPPPGDMTDAHLSNTIFFLHRRCEETINAGWQTLLVLNNAPALDIVENQLDLLEEMGPAAMTSAYKQMLVEARKRGLSVPEWHDGPLDDDVRSTPPWEE